jgi:hypothetical protein
MELKKSSHLAFMASNIMKRKTLYAFWWRTHYLWSGPVKNIELESGSKYQVNRKQKEQEHIKLYRCKVYSLW